MLCVSDTVNRGHLAKLCLEVEHETQKPRLWKLKSKGRLGYQQLGENLCGIVQLTNSDKTT